MTQNLFETLKRWDIEFSIGPEMLKSLMEYLASFRHEMYIKFFDKRMFMQSRSSDNTQYSDVEILADGVKDYNANIPEGLEEKYKNFTNDEKVKYRNIFVTGEGVHKRVLLNIVDKSATTPMAELLMFLGKNPVKVRIDTLYDKKIEFTIQRGMNIWWRLMDPHSEDTKAVENMPGVVAKIRNDTSIGKAVLSMEPGLFKRICFLGGKSTKGGTAHTRGFFDIDKNTGLTIASGDNMRGRVLKLGVLGSNLANYDNLGNRKKGEYEEVGREEKFEDNSETPFVSKDEFEDNGEEGFEDEDNGEEGFENSFIPDVAEPIANDMFSGGVSSDDEVPFLTSDDISGRSKKQDKKKDKKNSFEDDLDKEQKKKSKKKEEENIMDEAITNDLSSAEVDVRTQMWMEIPFLSPILKLNGLAPILIEMRNGKPLVVEQKPYPDMRVMLTIAPRIETEDND